MSPCGCSRSSPRLGSRGFFEAVVQEGEEDLLADPERLVVLAARYDTEVLGDYPDA